MAGKPWTEEQKKRASERMKKLVAEGRFTSPMTDPAIAKKVGDKLRGRRGRKATAETREKISKTRKRKIASGEIDLSLQQAQFVKNVVGRPITDYTREKLSRSLKTAYAEGRKRRQKTPEERQKISEGTKRAYAEGRLTPPTTKPEVAAKISATKRKKPTEMTPEVRAKISETLKEGYASGRIQSPEMPEGHFKRLANMKRGKAIPKERAEKISQAVTRRWDEGAFDVRHYSATIRYPGYPTPTEKLLEPGLLPLGFVQQLALTTGRRYQSGHLQTYYYDFAHESAGLIIEVDGETHRTPKGRATDAAKERLAAKKGFTVLRFTNEEVVADPDSVVARVRSRL